MMVESIEAVNNIHHGVGIVLPFLLRWRCVSYTSFSRDKFEIKNDLIYIPCMHDLRIICVSQHKQA